MSKDISLRLESEAPCILCGAVLTRERHHGERQVFFYGCPHCDSRYYASTLYAQTWSLKDDREKARIRERVNQENANKRTPNLSEL